MKIWNIGACRADRLNTRSGVVRWSLTLMLFATASNAFAQALIPIDVAMCLDVREGAIPVVVSAPHGGEADVPGLPERTGGDHDVDYKTYELAVGIYSELGAIMVGRTPFLVASRVARKYVDFNRAASQAYESEAAAPLYRAYHEALSAAVSRAKAMGGDKAILIDVHGQSRNPSRTYRGTQNGRTADNGWLYRDAPPGFAMTLLQGGLDLWPADHEGREHRDYNGGFIVMVQGLSGSGGINAIQLEFGISHRDSPEALATTARVVAEALAVWLGEVSSTM